MMVSDRSDPPGTRAPRGRRGPQLPCLCDACKRKVAVGDILGSGVTAPLCLPCLRRRPDAAFAQRLLSCRLAAGLTRGQLAARVGGSENTLVRYESGMSEPSQTRLFALVQVLGDDLLVD
jgi:DNA-binding XRE family transcriptional regulator